LGFADVDRLIAREYAVFDQEYTNTFLASILVQLTLTLPAEGASLVKSVAILLDELDLNLHADCAASALMDTLAGPFEEFIEVGAAVKTQVDRVIEEHDTLENRVLDIVSRLEDLHALVLETREQTRLVTATAESIKDHIETIPPLATNPGHPAPESQNPNTYARRAQLPAIHSKVMARNDERLRQVMFTKAQGMASQGLDSHDPQTIVAKANLALKAMTSSHNDIPKGIQFLSAKTLRRGDIVFDMDSPQSAEWLRKEGVRIEFMQGFGAMSEIKDREHACVIENVPVNFYPSIELVREVENTNNLTPNSILLTRWIKPIERRFSGQRTAFMIATFRTAEDANYAILNNLYICGKRCTTRKLLPEPRRCFKCHAINSRHIAANCKEITDICDTCGGAHLPKDCTLKDEDPSRHFCINCKTHGHGARDRLCPTYIKQCNNLNTRMPENLYKFFPTDNPSTWELADSSQDIHLHPSPDNANDDWTPVTHKKRKQYPYLNAQPQDQPNNRNKTTITTAANSVPLGQRKQAHLDDMGIASTRPGPTQQYRTPSQRQQAEDHRASQQNPPPHASQQPPPSPNAGSTQAVSNA
jgi:hypothetical protein